MRNLYELYIRIFLLGIGVIPLGMVKIRDYIHIDTDDTLEFAIAQIKHHDAVFSTQGMEEQDTVRFLPYSVYDFFGSF